MNCNRKQVNNVVPKTGSLNLVVCHKRLYNSISRKKQKRKACILFFLFKEI